jgi:hypothetical protein
MTTPAALRATPSGRQHQRPGDASSAEFLAQAFRSNG